MYEELTTSQGIIIRVVLFVLFAPFAYGFFSCAKYGADRSPDHEHYIPKSLRSLWYVASVAFLLLSFFTLDVCHLFQPK